MRPRLHVLALAALLCACKNQSGDVQLSIVAPAGPSPFLGLAQVRLTVRHPGNPDVKTGPVSADGAISLDLQLAATGASADVVLEGLDASGTVKVRGRVPPFGLVAATGTFAIWVAPVGASSKLPITAPALLGHAAVPLPFGVLFAGGRGADGKPSDKVVVYDQFFLGQPAGLETGDPLPDARDGLTGVGSDSLGGVYLLGGKNAAGHAQSDLWRFDLTVAPSGLYTTIPLANEDLLRAARFGAAGVQLGEIGLVVGGSADSGPADGALIVTMPSTAGVSPQVSWTMATPRLAPAAAAGGTASAPIVVIAGGAVAPAPAAELFAPPPNARFTALTQASLVGASELGADTLADGRVVFAGGRNASGPLGSVFVYDPVAGSFLELPATLATPRSRATVTRVGGEVLVAGGLDAAGNVLGDAEVLDGTTLARLAVVPLADARAEHTATRLANETVLLAGGHGADGLPLASFEIYTPAKE